MFLLNEILVFSPGRRQEAFDRLAYIHGLMARSAGFRQAFVARSLGDPFRHAILRLWESADAYQAFRAGPDGTYGRNRPEGLYVNEKVVPQWESFADWDDGSGGGDLLVNVERPVPAALWEAYERYTRGVLGLAKDAAGPCALTAFRAAGGDAALSIGRFRSRADLERFVDAPALVAAQRSLPEGLAPPRIECFEIVATTGPSR